MFFQFLSFLKPKYIFYLFVLSPILTKGQVRLAEKYIDDRVNNYTYLEFSSDSSFEYRYLYDLSGDFAKGHYKLHKDTLFLFYDPDSTVIKQKFLGILTSHDERNRADSLLIKGKKLFRIKNGIGLYDAKPDVIDKKSNGGWHPSKNSPYRRKYFLFGRYQTVRTKRYYMVDIQSTSLNMIQKRE